MSERIEINNPYQVQIGNHNTQNMNVLFDTLIEAVNNSETSENEKKEAKGILKKLVEHPVFKSLIGTGIDLLTKKLE